MVFEGVTSIGSPAGAGGVNEEAADDDGRIGIVLCIPGASESAAKGLRRTDSALEAMMVARALTRISDSAGICGAPLGGGPARSKHVYKSRAPGSSLSRPVYCTQYLICQLFLRITKSTARGPLTASYGGMGRWRAERSQAANGLAHSGRASGGQLGAGGCSEARWRSRRAVDGAGQTGAARRESWRWRRLESQGRLRSWAQGIRVNGICGDGRAPGGAVLLGLQELRLSLRVASARRARGELRRASATTKGASGRQRVGRVMVGDGDRCWCDRTGRG